LDKILETFSPSLSFLQYRKLTKAGIYIYTKRTDYEYYGNYTEYRKREIDLTVLYTTLKDIVG